MKTISTGIPGLDEILGGGFIKPSVVMVAGPAGSGKTTFAVQSLFNAVVEKGEKGLFMPTISEPVAMVNNFMSQYSFYDLSVFEKRNMLFCDMSTVAGTEWEDIVKEIRVVMEKNSPSWVVIDPLTVLGYGMSDMEHRHFLNELFATIKGWNAMVLVTGEFTRERLVESPYSYMVDGIIYLGTDHVHCPGSRYVEIIKQRGKKTVPGRHFFRIGPAGIHVYPRVLPTRETCITPGKRSRYKTGIKGYDYMLGGGYLSGSTNMVAGSGGTGKTMFGLTFIAEGVKADQRGLVVVFEESPAKTVRDAEGLGMPLSQWVESRMVQFLYYPAGDSHPEEVAWGIKSIVEQAAKDGKPIKRLFFDSLSGFANIVPDERSLNNYLANLDAYLSGSGVTSVFTANLPEVMGDFALGALRNAIVMDSATILRYVEVESTVNRFLAVLMMKGSDHQKDIRQYVFEGGTINVLEKFHGLEGLLSGTARKTSGDVANVLREALPESQRHFLGLDKKT
ncbi:MAG: ATPase domain-containing protein [Candidatus Thermoplasmatota archaeon]|nr:ATPase domain-containing protein [Candidatus Thermoplasmatota archaeon]